MLSLIVTLLALTIVIVTTVARLNDIGKDKSSKHWHARRAGLFFTGGCAAGIGVYRLFGLPIPELLLTAFFAGLATMLVTTPGHVPWWQFITGDFLRQREDGSFGLIARLLFRLKLAEPKEERRSFGVGGGGRRLHEVEIDRNTSEHRVTK